jgi:hypothetical protein
MSGTRVPRDRPEASGAERAPLPEITPEMVEAAWNSLWRDVQKLNIVTWDEIPKETIAAMVKAALSERTEPRRVCRRLFRLSHAAIAGWSSVA